MTGVGRTRHVMIAATLLTGLAACSGPEVPSVTAPLPPPSYSLPPLPSPSTKPPQPAGAACSQVLQALSESMKVNWRKRDDSAHDDKQAGRPGMRSCVGEASGTSDRPPAFAVFQFYRPDPAFDSPEKVELRALEHSEGCLERMTGAPDTARKATSCVKRRASTLTESTTTLLSEAGWVLVFVSGQHKTTRSATAQAEKYVDSVSRRGAVLALPMI